MSEKIFDGELPAVVPVAIGIDQSLTGFAFSAVQVDDPIRHLTKVYKSPFTGVERLADIQNWMDIQITSLLDNKNVIQDIAMEGTVLASHSALVLGELAAAVKLYLFNQFEGHSLLRTPLQIPPMTLKKFVTGKGNSKKQEMLMQIYKKYGVEFNNDNAADAYSLGRLATGFYISEIEKTIIEKVKDPKYRDTIK